MSQVFLSAGDTPVRAPDEIEPEVLEEMDLDGDGVGAADPEHDVRAGRWSTPANDMSDAAEDVERAVIGQR